MQAASKTFKIEPVLIPDETSYKAVLDFINEIGPDKMISVSESRYPSRRSIAEISYGYSIVTVWYWKEPKRKAPKQDESQRYGGSLGDVLLIDEFGDLA